MTRILAHLMTAIDFSSHNNHQWHYREIFRDINSELMRLIGLAPVMIPDLFCGQVIIVRPGPVHSQMVQARIFWCFLC